MRQVALGAPATTVTRIAGHSPTLDNHGNGVDV